MTKDKSIEDMKAELIEAGYEIYTGSSHDRWGKQAQFTTPDGLPWQSKKYYSRTDVTEDVKLDVLREAVTKAYAHLLKERELVLYRRIFQAFYPSQQIIDIVNNNFLPHDIVDEWHELQLDKQFNITAESESDESE